VIVDRPGEGDQVEGQDEEFVFRLGRGSELLAAGDLEGARSMLARALELRPRDAEVLGLLGQACYRLGWYGDAITAWGRLVDESPAEPAARINLGLAFLRADRHPEAIRQLEIALDLNPEHKKAMGYLGLAFLEAGDPARAREWFLKAGSDQMVARCDQALAAAAPAGAPPPAPAPAAVPATARAEAATLAEVEIDDAGPPVEVASLAAAVTVPELAPVVPVPHNTTAPLGLEPAAEAPAARPAGPEGVAVPLVPALPDVAAFAATRRVAVAEGSTFAVADGVLWVRVRTAVRVRLRGLLAARGALRAEPEVKRFHGKPTDKPFGHGPARLQRIAGQGSLLLSVGETSFTALALGGEAFVREEALFGLEEEVAFENGRVPSPGAGGLDLVHLRGQGAVLLSTAGPPRAVEVSLAAAVRLPVEALVGWIGALTPRFVPLFEGGAPEALAVELAGEGTALVDPGQAGPGARP
jgi:thioredoxin-like negative regulator of GroEL